MAVTLVVDAKDHAMGILNLFRRNDQRRHARHKVITTAWLRLKDNTVPFVCVLWDVSEGGARLTAANMAEIPDEFTLVLSRDAPTGTSCRAVWRSRDEMGVQFIDGSDLISHLIKQKPAANALLAGVK
jgi:hypothetical protein